jgi:2-polyprenyl-6-methoxyphenol hydroxylase-like FAD-dependent oxidoreductase
MSSSGETVEMPVLTVGGGPIGLALACDLGQRGASCLVLEQGEGQSDHARATALNSRQEASPTQVRIMYVTVRISSKSVEAQSRNRWNAVIIRIRNGLQQLGRAIAALGRDDTGLRHVSPAIIVAVR